MHAVFSLVVCRSRKTVKRLQIPEWAQQRRYLSMLLLLLLLLTMLAPVKMCECASNKKWMKSRRCRRWRREKRVKEIKNRKKEITELIHLFSFERFLLSAQRSSVLCKFSHIYTLGKCKHTEIHFPMWNSHSLFFLLFRLLFLCSLVGAQTHAHMKDPRNRNGAKWNSQESETAKIKYDRNGEQRKRVDEKLPKNESEPKYQRKRRK